jgi:hypothetical protein
LPPPRVSRMPLGGLDSLRVLYFMATIGALTVLVSGLAFALVFLNWLSQPIPYLVLSGEMQQFFASWGRALGDRGKIVVRQPNTDRSLLFLKREFKARGDCLVLRVRNADQTRKYFDAVRSAFASAGTDVRVELTPTGKPRTLLLEFSVDDPLCLQRQRTPRALH